MPLPIGLSNFPPSFSFLDSFKLSVAVSLRSLPSDIVALESISVEAFFEPRALGLSEELLTNLEETATNAFSVAFSARS